MKKTKITRFVDLLNNILYDRPREKRLNKYKSQIDYYSSLEIDEIKSEYTYTLTKLNHNRMLFVGIAITFLITLLSVSWKLLFKLMIGLIKSRIYTGNHLLTIEYLFLALGITISVCIILAFIVLSDNLKHLEFKKNILEDVLKRKNQNEDYS